MSKVQRQEISYCCPDLFTNCHSLDNNHNQNFTNHPKSECSTRNLQIGYLMVEGASEEEDLEDPYQGLPLSLPLPYPYQGGLPTCLPYTLESFKAASKQSPGFPKKGACSTFFSRLQHGNDPMKYPIDRSQGCAIACAHVAIRGNLIFDSVATI